MAAAQASSIHQASRAILRLPIHSRSTAGQSLRASNGPDVCVSPTAGAWLCCQHNTPGHAFHQLHPMEARISQPACLTAAHCILIQRNLPFVMRVNSN